MYIKMKSTISIFAIGMLTFASVSAFTTGRPATPPSATQLHMTSSRRNFFQTATVFGMAAATTIAAPPAFAKMPTEPLTEENKKAAFDDLRFELNDPKGGVSIMQSRIDDLDFVGLMEITKNYDLNVRKLKIGRCKAYLSKPESAIATMTANAITFDLIGINRSARAGQENQSECNRYLNELRTDLQAVIDQEKTVSLERLQFE
jgi:hypothetical protein